MGGLAGMALALLGAHVTFTDLPVIVPALEANVRANLSAGGPGPRPEVVPLDWRDEGEATARLVEGGPFDLVVGTDCVYAPELVEPLLRTVLRLCGPRTAVVLSHEPRDEHVDVQFREAFAAHFRIAPVPLKERDPEHAGPATTIWVLHPLPASRAPAATPAPPPRARANASGNGAVPPARAAPLDDRVAFARDVCIGHPMVVEMRRGCFLHGLFHDLRPGPPSPAIVLRHVTESRTAAPPSHPELAAVQAERVVPLRQATPPHRVLPACPTPARPHQTPTRSFPARSEAVQAVARDVKMAPQDVSSLGPQGQEWQEHAVGEFQTDTDISRARADRFGRDLQRWDDVAGESDAALGEGVRMMRVR